MLLKTKNVGPIMMLVLSLLPIVFWVAMKPVGERFVSTMTTLTSLGQLTGLVGMAMFSLVLVLSGKFKFLEDFFGGLGGVYLAHHIFGGLAFVLLLAHPLVLAGKYLLVSPYSAAMFLLPGGDWDMNFGIFALVAMIILLVITFFVRLGYEKWRLAHKILGFAFFLAGIHGLLVQSDVSRSALLRGYMIFLALLGLAAYVYRTVLGRFLVGKYDYALIETRNLGNGIVEMELAPQGEPMQFTPGQFAFISFQNRDLDPEEHPFTISSSQYDKNIRIAVKALGDFTEKLAHVKGMTLAKIEGPFGRFFSQEPKEQIWIAGGIGVTPFLSMARNLWYAKSAITLFYQPYGKLWHVPDTMWYANNAITLFYCTSHAEEAVFLKELSEIADRNKNFKVIPVYSDTHCRITAERLANVVVGGLNDKQILICGPPQMMKSLRDQLLKLGVPNTAIISEEFQL